MRIVAVQQYPDGESIEFGIIDDDGNFTHVWLETTLYSDCLRQLEVDSIAVQPGSREAKQVLAALNLWWKSLSPRWTAKDVSLVEIRPFLDNQKLKAVRINQVLLVKNYLESHYVYANEYAARSA